MKIINLKSKEYRKLKPFLIDEDVTYNEANFYKAPHDNSTIFKLYRTKQEDRLVKKEEAVVDIMLSAKDINIPELVLPKAIVTVEDSFKGIALDHIEGCNLSILLKPNTLPLKSQIELLKELGSILEKVKKANPSLNLALGDVHLDNFMISNKKIYAIDTDGINIHSHTGRVNYYLVNSLANSTDKYPLADDGIIKATTDTDIFCFIMIILELVSNNKTIYRISLEEYKRYLDYLDHLGFNTKLLESFASIYNPSIDNINPTNYLDNLIINSKTSYNEFKKHF